MAQQIITLARDADLETLPNGGEQIFWSDSATWGLSAGAAGVRMQVVILSATADTYLTLIGQSSNDGRSWFDFEESIDGVEEPEPVTPTSEMSVRQYAGPPWQMAPFVRYGLRTWRTGGLQGRIRLSCDLIVLPALDPARLTVADGATITGVGPIGGVECTYGYDRGSVYIHATAFSGITSVTVVVETSLVRNAPESGWRPVATVPSLSSFSAGARQYVEVSGLDAYTRIRATAVSGSGSATFTSYAFFRPAN